MLKTPLCDLLGIEYPILLAGMGVNIAGPELTAAVSNAGGCGVLGSGGLPAQAMRAQISALQALTDRPFGVNIILPMLQPGQVEVALEAKVPFVVFFWGDPSPWIPRLREAGIKIFLQVGTVEEGIAAAAAGVDGIIAQGIEAGGHVKAESSLSTIVPALVDAVAPLPVIASGGIANGRGIAAALALGAQGVSLGSRFLATPEARVGEAYKQMLVDARAEDTVYTSLFDVGWENAAHRVLRNTETAEWERAGSPAPGARPGEGSVIGRAELFGTFVDFPRYAVTPPIAGFEGELQRTALYAGESVRLINDIRPAADVVAELVREAGDALRMVAR
jgi:NAD(P)H-dependent flavin oxidoreductase YrpB (nitropropane dioxygenase family)